MSILQANCPSCGGQVQFTAGSTIVVVCPYCRSAIARADALLYEAKNAGRNQVRFEAG